MSNFATRTYVDGTAARKIERPARKQASIISFPDKRSNRRHRSSRPQTSSLSDAIFSILRRSEMACSLLFETCAGCAYQIFTQHQAFRFSIALVALLAVGIVLGV